MSQAQSESLRVAILGAGPAGMSCALWLKQLGLRPWLIERQSHVGGMQNLNFLHNEWVLGQLDVSGPQLAARFQEHLASVAIAPALDAARIYIRKDASNFFVQVGGAAETPCAAVVIATGTRYRSEEVLREVGGRELIDPSRVIYGPYAFSDIEACRERTVLIVGGGDNALENARIVLANGGRAIVAARSAFRAQRWMMQTAAQSEHCELLAEASLRSLATDGERIRATVRVGVNHRDFYIDRVHVLAGYAPNTADLGAILAPDINPALDGQSYIRVDAAQRTSAPGIYAAGDVCNPEFPNVVSALAQGARAAKTIEADLLR